MGEGEREGMRRLRNYLSLELQKMELELKCPLCLNLLSLPVWLPCNHLFCSHCITTSNNGSDCPVCRLPFLHGDMRPANHMETIVNIYKGMCTALTANVLQRGPQVEIPDTKTPSSQSPYSNNIDAQEKSQEPLHDTPRGKSSNTQSPGPFSGNVNEVEETKSVKKAFLKQEPYSPSSFGEEYDSNDPGNESRTKRQRAKFSSKNDLGVGSSLRTDAIARERKRQKLHNEADLGNMRCTNTKDFLTCNSEAELELERNLGMQSLHATTNIDTSRLVECVFCHSFRITEASGPMLYYLNGIPIVAENAIQPNVMHVHQKCIEWAPQVYFEGETAMNLTAEVSRAAKIKCSCCGLKGAALGCYVKSCRKSFHVPCAVMIPECRWDCDNFLVLCPAHTEHKLPCDKSSNKKKIKAKSSSSVEMGCSDIIEEPTPSKMQQGDKLWAAPPALGRGWVLCGSFLSSEEKDLMYKFASLTGADVAKGWKESVTHVIASTDEHGAFTRTLKVLMGILSGKWILKIDWVKACIEAGHPVPEEPYEISHDVHGCFNGPKNGRLRVLEKEPKLFSGLSFYFNGYYMPYYKVYLEDLVNTGGGTILKQNDLLSSEYKSSKEISRKIFVVYGVDPPQGCSATDLPDVIKKRSEEAEVLAAKTGARVIAHTWLLDTISACSLPEN